MGSQLRYLHLALFSFLVRTAALFSAEPIAKPNCPTHCGPVQIPFPFGIVPGCSIDGWFDVACAGANGTVPHLRRAGLDVAEISVGGTLKVRIPAASANCSDRNDTLRSPDLTGSPFLYSSRGNRFTAVSCGAIALLSSGGSAVGGCLSICGAGSGAPNKSCGGVGCCQTTIPSSMAAFETTFRTIEGERGDGRCRYAFLADQEWFESRTTDISAAVSEVTVVLEWELYNTTTEVFGRDVGASDGSEENFSSSFLWDEDNNRIGYINSSCKSIVAAAEKSNRSRLECRCPEGYSGNPYLDKGCRDINECAYISCAPGARCLNYNGHYACYLPLRKRSKAREILIGVGSSVGPLLLISLGFISYKVIKRIRDAKREKKYFQRNGGILLQQQLSSGESNNSVEKIVKLFKAKELEKATDHFNRSRILGQGGQGTVYKGMLEDGRIVAVKKSKILVDDNNDDDAKGKLADFVNEIVVLSQINHRNVVQLLGCCLETEVPLLVYEYIPNGTLSHYILGRNDDSDFLFSWETRVRIAAEVAGALSYLHSAASSPIFHRDIKSTNILLDEKYRAKIADFGTSRSVPIDQTHLTTLVHGTFGYLDPEYFQSSKFTEKSDVYSFGVVLVELLTGQKPVSVVGPEEVRSLVSYFMLSLEEDCLFDIVDPRILSGKEGEREAIAAFADLAKRCLNLKGKRRPSMKEVATVLEDINRMSMNCSSFGNEQSSFKAAEDMRNRLRGHGHWDVGESSTWSSSYIGTETGSSS